MTFGRSGCVWKVSAQRIPHSHSGGTADRCRLKLEHHQENALVPTGRRLGRLSRPHPSHLSALPPSVPPSFLPLPLRPLLSQLSLCPSAHLSLAVFSVRSSRALSPSLSLRPSPSPPYPRTEHPPARCTSARTEHPPARCTSARPPPVNAVHTLARRTRPPRAQIRPPRLGL